MIADVLTDYTLSQYEIYSSLIDSIIDSLTKVGFAIVSLIFNLIGYVYSVFNAIAGARLFNNGLVSAFTNRIYMILGIVMLFVVAYSFLNIIINPENMTKGNTSSSKIVLNILVSLITIIIVPTVFNFAYAVQQSVVEEGVINKLILGISNVNGESNSPGVFATNLFTMVYSLNDLDNSPLSDSDKEDVIDRYNDATIQSQTSLDTSVFMSTYDDLKAGYISFNFIFGIVVGIFILYSLIVYCFDIALRSIKLLVYQFITPIPALFYIVPGQEKILKTWVKEIIKTFLELFLKLAIMYLGVFLISAIFSLMGDGTSQLFQGMSTTMRNVTGMFLILGVVMFIRRAPKLIEDIFGIKLTEQGLSLRKRLDESGFTALIGGAAGAVAGSVSSVKGAQARGANRLAAGLGGAFHGARLGGKAGWQGSYNGIGNAYNYGWANQQAWSHMDPNRGYLANQLSVAGEMLRDNVGMQSYYDDLRDKARIEHDVITSKNNRKIQAIDTNFNEKAKEIDGKYEFDARSSANSRFMDAANKSNDTAKAEVYKDGYVETTKMFVPVYKEESEKIDIMSGKKVTVPAHYELEEQDVTASQFERIKSTLSEAVTNGFLVNEEQAILAEIDSAEKRLKTDYDTNTLVAEKRQAGKLSTQIKDSFVNSYIENMKSQKHWDGTKFIDFEKLSSTDQQSHINQWTIEANSRYADITVNRKDDYKLNSSHATELHQVLDLASIASRDADSRGFIDDAAGQSWDSSQNKFVVSSAISNISKDIDNIVSGTDIQAAIKSVKNMDVNGERDAVYRETTIEVDKTPTIMAQAQHIKQSLIDANAKADKDLEAKMLSLKSDEQTAEAARKIGKFNASSRDSGKK